VIDVHVVALLVMAVAGVGCAPQQDEAGSPYAVAIVSYAPGPGAGFGQDSIPDVVLGPPAPAGSAAAGSLDVLSLGQGGSIVLRLGRPARDGPGPDLLIFENPFQIAGGERIFGESGEVAVSVDGERFEAFSCAAEEVPAFGCAGWGVVRGAPSDFPNDAPLEPQAVGGDAFDLATVGMDEATFVRITDRAQAAGAVGGAPSAGFDLDAVAVAASSAP
jgi:hypothetical protein